MPFTQGRHCCSPHLFHAPPAGRFVLWGHLPIREDAHWVHASPPAQRRNFYRSNNGASGARNAGVGRQLDRPKGGRSSDPCRGRALTRAACGRAGPLTRKPRLPPAPPARPHRPASAGRCGRAYPVCAIMYFESVHTFAEDHSSFCAHMHRQEEYQHVWQGNEPLLLWQERSGGL